MKRLIIVAILALAAWQGYNMYQSRRTAKAVAQPVVEPANQFKCDGRTRCSQMTSCEEATFFLKNCPGVEMDGDFDGIPCEK
jgi:Tfp pilus assembly protein PilE